MNDAEVAEVREMMRKLLALRTSIDGRLYGALEIATTGLETLLAIDDTHKRLSLKRVAR
jgi:hypothetical protein